MPMESYKFLATKPCLYHYPISPRFFLTVKLNHHFNNSLLFSGVPIKKDINTANQNSTQNENIKQKLIQNNSYGKRYIFYSSTKYRQNKHVGALGNHDVGGLIAIQSMNSDPPNRNFKQDEEQEVIDSPIQHWEKQVHATLGLLCSKHYMTVDELRRGIEYLPKEIYETYSYYEKWALSITTIMLERNILTHEDFHNASNTSSSSESCPFNIHDIVQVREESNLSLYFPKPHLRTPGYIFGKVGKIVQIVGEFANPELLAFCSNSNSKKEKQLLYRVEFNQTELWPDYYKDNESKNDTIVVDIYHHWLSLPSSASLAVENKCKKLTIQNNEQNSGYSHGHYHGEHDHEHSRDETEQNAILEEGQETHGQRIATILIKTLFEKKILTPGEMRRALESFDTMGIDDQQNLLGAKLVVKAWKDPSFKKLLLHNGNEAAKVLGISVSPAHAHVQLIVVENTPDIHNVIVCTLCSCYPLALLGPSPSWYKSRSYRARVIRDPKTILQQEFGNMSIQNKQICVHDSTADCRYMVLPEPPLDLESKSEDELAQLVTRDRMIGVIT